MAETKVRRSLGSGASLEALRASIGRPRPASLRDLLDAYQQPVVLESPLVTAEGVALGGHQKVTVHRDGRWKFEGHFRATGWPSYRVSLASRLEGGNGAVVVFTARGEVHGTNEPGDREHAFAEEGRSGLIQQRWADIRQASLHHDLQYDADFFGTPGEFLAFVGKLAAASTALGGAGVVIVCGSEAIDQLDRQDLAIPGLVGVAIASGVLMVTGPSGLVPAVLAGVAVGHATAEAVEQRPLAAHETALADRVFGGTIPWHRVLVTNLLGLGNRPFTMPGPGDSILVNLGEGARDPVAYRGKGTEETRDGKPIQAPGQLLIHELTHAWQISHTEFMPGLMCTGVLNQVGTLGGDMSVYRYASPNLAWEDYNLEQQASIVDDWFAGNQLAGTYSGSSQQSTFAPMLTSDDPPTGNPYWRLIRDHIRAGVR